MLTDENGSPRAVVSDGANVHDIKFVLKTLEALECCRLLVRIPISLRQKLERKLEDRKQLADIMDPQLAKEEQKAKTITDI